MKEKIYTWFIDTLGCGHTNEIIAREATAGCYDIAEAGELLCSDGKKRRLWRCNGEFIAHLKRNRVKFGLKFLVFVKEGGGGIRPWNLQSRTGKKKHSGGEKRWTGETQHGSSPWHKRYTSAVSEVRAIRNMQIQHNTEHGRLLDAFVNVENVREVK